MDCARSIELLSDFHDGALNATDQAEVRAHLCVCQPCAFVLEELNVIVVAADGLRLEPGISFPDETVLWQRIEISKRIIH
jgi:hypothetical protein